MTSQEDDTVEAQFGKHLALAVGVGGLGGALYVALSGGAPVVATILVLIGGSALSGWNRARRKT